ncbi:MAG: glycosyltransferase family 2 protein [Lachnospiraceae bacterium]|nr:glycosyltransferase family 2 protein [Lachnospiraceae bacterium]
MARGKMAEKQQPERDMPLVSVIIPVYNVDKYLDECIESVVKQTYTNLEILLMEGKSTDDSLNICVKWLKLDDRISLVSRKDGGLGPARNFGIQMAKGEYIFFVDSDDYLLLDAIEMLMHEIEDETIDMVAGGYCKITEQGDIQKEANLIVRGCSRQIVEKSEKEKYIRRGIVAAWGKLYRADFWKRTNLQMPAGPAEDAVVFPSVVVMANKIICIDKPVCHYRIRENSLYNNVLGSVDVYKILDGYCRYLQEEGKFEEYRKALFYFSCMHLKEWEQRLKKVIPTEEEYCDRVKKPFGHIIEKYFGNSFESKCILAIGSYNLRWICHKVHPYVKCDEHMAFTTTISQFYNRQLVAGAFSHPNTFRQMSLQNDQRKTVLEKLKNLDKDTNLVLLDFLDDLQDIVILKDGSVLTYSEPFIEAQKQNIDIDHVVSCMGKEYDVMWKKACDNLICYLEEISCNIALVRSRLCKRYMRQEFYVFPNQEEIEKKNRFIEHMEEYFLKHMKREVQVITIPENLRYTDGDFHYGCKAEYLGQAGQYEIAEQIFDQFEL